MRYWDSNHMMGWDGGVFMIFWWALIVLVIVVLVRWVIDQSNKSNRREEKSPLEILRERYARGEIDKKEFEEKKKDLKD